MILRYSLGQRMAGRVCAADEAFHTLQHKAAMLGDGGTWQWFADRFGTPETALWDAGGFDENLARQMESPYAFVGRQEDLDRHLLTERICAEMDDLVGAFFVALQPRLNAVKRAAERVYCSATTSDQLPIAPPKAMVTPAAFEHAWQLANYIKHRDEWRQTLNKGQQRCFEALVALGVATVVDGTREFDRWPLIEAACAISGEPTLAKAVLVIVQRCESACRDIENSIQTAFSEIAADVDRVRTSNVPRLRVRAQRPTHHV